MAEYDWASASQSYWIAHGTLMILAWGFFIPLGTLLAVYRRYVGENGKILRKEPSFYPWHRNLQWFGFLLCMIAFGMAAAGNRRAFGDGGPFYEQVWNFRSGQMPWNRHVRIGTSILIISSTEVLLGMAAHFLKDRHNAKPDAGAWKRPIIPSWLHIVMGTVCVLLAYIDIFMGLQIYDFIFYGLQHSPGILAGYSLVSILGFMFLSAYLVEKVRLVHSKRYGEETTESKQLEDDEEATPPKSEQALAGPVKADEEATPLKTEDPAEEEEEVEAYA